jgi:hypothetical protein
METSMTRRDILGTTGMLAMLLGDPPVLTMQLGAIERIGQRRSEAEGHGARLHGQQSRYDGMPDCFR